MSAPANRLEEFKRYHFDMDAIGDIDPSYPLLLYLCRRFELNVEQRYWLAFLYSATYCAATVYYIYNEFPDFENVDVGRLERWWTANRHRLKFQTDRRWIRSRNQFVQMFVSYREHILRDGQAATFQRIQDSFSPNSPRAVYREAYQHFGKVFQMGRFGLFLYLEAVQVVTGFNMEPDGMDWEHAESSRNGLYYAVGYDQLLRGNDYGDEPLAKEVLSWTGAVMETVMANMRADRPEARLDMWNVETTLCAFKKFKRGKRYPGYYIDRQGEEIAQMEKSVPEGVCWDVLWDFRREQWPQELLAEAGGQNGKIWQEWLRLQLAAGQEPVYSPEVVNLNGTGEAQ